ncbi:DUF4466 family protein [Arcticibacter svalbardensis]|nr:DUF4466 family protein [Arcticibacter svalbardensis]
MKSKYFQYSHLLLLFIFLMAACKDDDYSIPDAGTALQNDCIKRSLGPNMVGLKIEFAYAMALPKTKGNLVSAQVEASIAGASTTYLENNSYYTNGSGVDVAVPIGLPSVNDGAVTTVTFNVDTSAATLRYYYVVPEAARGKTVSFTFSAKSSDGAIVSYKMGPYDVPKMDYKLNMVVTDGANCYVSIADMAVYDQADAALNADKIDLVYLYRSLTPLIFEHALVAPAADAQYRPGVTLPSGVNKNTKVLKVYGLQDRDLSNLQYNEYVDDLDFQQLDLSTAANFAINLKVEAGVWVETADGKYRAYIFVNSVSAGTTKQMTISMKRYLL